MKVIARFFYKELFPHTSFLVGFISYQLPLFTILHIFPFFQFPYSMTRGKLGVDLVVS